VDKVDHILQKLKKFKKLKALKALNESCQIIIMPMLSTHQT
jgi:hypothetical protein